LSHEFWGFPKKFMFPEGLELVEVGLVEVGLVFRAQVEMKDGSRGIVGACPFWNLL
jgi:hypothetical protein